MEANDAHEALMARHLGTEIREVRGVSKIVPIYRPVDDQDEPFLLALADQAGQDGDCHYEAERYTAAESPLIRKIKRTYRKARKEATDG